MTSAYKNLHSYPHHKDQTHHGPYSYPESEIVPPMNPTRPPTGHVYWPWGNNHGCASPAAYHGCCNHSYWPPHYAWGSPYCHVLQYHCPVSCYPHPIQYMPPPGYAVEPRYEYEKNYPNVHHCYGCPNHHPMQPKEQKTVRIEETEPDRELERRKNDDVKFPFQLSNQPYPIVWLPPDYINSKELNKESSERPPNENGKVVDAELPCFWNGWYPLDLDRMVSSKQRGDEGRNNLQKDVDANGQNPSFPLIWMPYNPDQKEEHKMNEQNAKPHLESEALGHDRNTSRAKNIPVIKVLQHEDKENSKDQDQERNVGGGHNSSLVKDIPVKELRHHEGMGKSKKQDQESKDSTRNSADDGEKKNLDNGEKKSTKMDARSSKLPPVCLRVDPLPRIKGTNGSSRSPSPPGEKHKPKKTPNEANQASYSSVEKKLNEISQNEVKAGKSVGRNVEVVDGKSEQEESDGVKEIPISIAVNSQEVLKSQTEGKPEEDECTKSDAAVFIDQSQNAGSSVKTEDEAKESKREFSEVEAAVIIQSAFRGFDIRRWEPIKKLRQIAEVREQMAEVKHRIQSLESSLDAESKSNQRCILGETIMNLLLKLDTIQGLHPSIREIRKSVVRELVNLQEELDSLKNRKSETAPVEESVIKQEEDDSNKTEDVVSSQNSSSILEDHQNQIYGGPKSENSAIATPAEANAVAESCTAKEFDSTPIIDNAMNNEVPVKGEENYDTSEATASEEETDGKMEKEVEENYDTSEATPAVEEADGKMGNEVEERCMSKESVSESPTGNDNAETEQCMSKELASESPTGNDNECTDLPVAVETSSSEDGNRPQMQTESCWAATADEGTELADNAQGVSGDVCDATTDLLEVNHRKVGEELNLKTSANEAAERSMIKELMPGPTTGEQKLSEVVTEMSKEEGDMTDSAPGDKVEIDAGEGSELTELTQGILNGEESSKDTSHQVSGEMDANNSLMLDESQDTSRGQEMHDQIIREGSLDALNKSADSYGLVTEGAIGVKEAAEEKRGHRHFNHKESLEDATLEANTNQDGLDGSSVVTRDTSTAHVLVAADEQTERNRKLMEENETLRAMMNKLMKAGEEQLTAISTLSGRVKDMEKKLSRKKKVKVKQHKVKSVKPSDGC